MKPEPSPLKRYGVTFLSLGLALVLMLLLDQWVPMRSSPFLIFFAAVMVSAWYGGLGAGLCATAFGALLSAYFFMPPFFSPRVMHASDAIRLCLFILIAVMITVLSSARRLLVRALRRERDLIAAIVSTAGSLIMVLDHRGRIIQFNRTCEHLTGYTFTEVQGKYPWDLFIPPEDIEAVKQVFQTLPESAVPNEYENDWLAKDGSRRAIAWSNNVLLDERGGLCCVICTGLDITERKQAEQSLQETNQALQALIQASPVAITVLDRRGIVKRWNPAAERIFGWQASEAINHIMPTVPADKQAEFLANIESTLQGEVLNGMETYRQRKDGSLIYVGLWTAVLRGLKAEDDSIMSIVVDLSERKQAEAALKLSQERLTTFVEANVVGILFGDIDGGIFEANDEFLRIVGYSRDDLKAGRLLWTKLTPAEHLPLDTKAIQEAQTGIGCVPYEKEYIRKDGSRVPVLIGFGLLGENREQTIAFILDLTERKRLEQTLRTQTEQLSQANRMKDEFLAVLSHELRTPLNSILGWAKMLRSRQFDAEITARALETIERNARLQNQLVEDILDISKITQGKICLQPRPVDLAGIVTATTDAMSPAAVAKSITINRCDRSSPTVQQSGFIVWGDPDRLQQAIWNLLSNAIKFTAEGGVVEVQLSIVPKEETLHHSGVRLRPEHSAEQRLVEPGQALEAGGETYSDLAIQKKPEPIILGREVGNQASPVNSNNQAANRENVTIAPQLAGTHYVQLTVTDTGKGISADFLPFVFDRFRQADSSSTRVEGGLGLGLAIVRQLVELHGGTIQAESPGLEKGSTFKLTLPLMSS
ncbi:MAG: PAS domain S-box protein [Leptolyngbya sp. BL-A-14]